MDISLVAIILIIGAVVLFVLDNKNNRNNPIPDNLKLADIKKLPKGDWSGFLAIGLFVLVLLVVYVLNS